MACLDENDVVRFLEGGATNADEDHIDACEDCRALVTELGRSLPEPDGFDEPLARGSRPGPDDGVEIAGWEIASGAELVARGSRVGRYVVLDAIGAGAMGIVYRAYDPELDRDVALKLVRVLGHRTRSDARDGERGDRGDRAGDDGARGDRARGDGARDDGARDDARDDGARDDGARVDARDDGAPGEAARARLVREAKALARVAHPNVVAVYDASSYGDHVFVAMELVDGADLEAWLAREPRSWRSIVEQFIAAGRGLAAAHAAGVIHRDVKAANILVGDNRARITDFGLAIASDESPRATAAGTPAYMSPEVAAGEPADERSDQYSFALALRRALARDAGVGRNEGIASTARDDGRRTSRDDGTARDDDRRGSRDDGRRTSRDDGTARDNDRRGSRDDGRRTSHDEGRRTSHDEGTSRDEGTARDGTARDDGRRTVPGGNARVRRAIARALAPAPSERFPSMTAFVDSLEHALEPRRWPLFVAAAAIAIAGGVALMRTRAPVATACAAPTDRLAGVWDAPTKAVLRDAVVASGHPLATDVWTRVKSSLDGFTRAWSTTYVDACAATHVRHEQSAELLDRRMACLSDELARLRAVTTQLASADKAFVGRAIGAADIGDRLARCSDLVALRASAPLPATPALRARGAAATSVLAYAEAISLRAKFAPAITMAKAVTLEARAIGDVRLEADSLRSAGETQWRSGDYTGALATLHDAVDAAKRAGGADLEAGALLDLVAVLVEQGTYGEGLQVARLAESTLRASGDDARMAKLLGNRGAIHYLQGDFAGARADYERALALFEKAFGPEDRRVGQTVMNLAMLAAEGDTVDPLPLYARALAIHEKALGPRHPEVALTLSNRAIALANAARFPEAYADLDRALALRTEVLGRDHRDTIGTLQTMALVAEEQKDYARAIAVQRDVLARFGTNVAADHPTRGHTLAAIGRAHVKLRQYRDAIEPLEQAIAIFDKAAVVGPASSSARYALARASWEIGGDRARARALVERAVKDTPPDGDADRRAEMQTWLASHGGTR